MRLDVVRTESLRTQLRAGGNVGKVPGGGCPASGDVVVFRLRGTDGLRRPRSWREGARQFARLLLGIVLRLMGVEGAERLMAGPRRPLPRVPEIIPSSICSRWETRARDFCWVGGETTLWSNAHNWVAISAEESKKAA
jgi:hypothetical protein